MKIRMDFVTNSSSSSFMVVNVSSSTLETYLSENGLEGIFDSLEYLSEDGDVIQAELNKSVAQSLIAILKKMAEELMIGSYSEEFIGADEEAIQDLIEFIKKNKQIIDAEANCEIELKYSDGEEGYAYVQSLVCKNRHGKLVKWPCTDGWNFQDGGGYGQIQEFSSKMFNGEITELDDIGYDAIWDIVWDDDALTTAIERTGIVEEFEVTKPTKDLKANYNKPKKPEVIRITSAPKTLKECRQLFKCEVYGGKLYIDDIKNNVAEVVIPSEVDGMPVVIDQSRCNKNKKIERIVFSEGFTTIGADCFNDCKNLKEVSFASTIKSVGSGVFKNSPWRKQQGDWLIINGILVSYTGKESEVVIPEGVTIIGDYAFSSMEWDWASKKALESVIIPESVKYIGDSAFNGCSNLKSIQLPDCDIEFGTNPFSGTAWAEFQPDWVIINGVLLGVTDKYYYSNFRDSTSLTIPEGIKIIGKNTLGFGIRKWENVKTIVLPEGLEVIGDNAFMEFKSLEEVHLPSTLTKIGNYAFYRCTSFSKVDFPDGLKEIGKSAFSDNSGWKDKPSTATAIEEVILPDTVEIIGDGAFAYCDNLKKLRLPKRIDIIPGALVHSCKYLEYLEMPEECREIGDDAFESCAKLTSINMPSGVEKLGRRVFYGCTNLQALDLPDSIQSFGWGAFKRCGAIISFVIPEGVTELPAELFEHCTSITNITVPSSVNAIEDKVFDDCPNLTLTVKAGSFAEQYAKENGIPFITE